MNKFLTKLYITNTIQILVNVFFLVLIVFELLIGFDALGDLGAKDIQVCLTVILATNLGLQNIKSLSIQITNHPKHNIRYFKRDIVQLIKLIIQFAIIVLTFLYVGSRCGVVNIEPLLFYNNILKISSLWGLIEILEILYTSISECYYATKLNTTFNVNEIEKLVYKVLVLSDYTDYVITKTQNDVRITFNNSREHIILDSFNVTISKEQLISNNLTSRKLSKELELFEKLADSTKIKFTITCSNDCVCTVIPKLNSCNN